MEKLEKLEKPNRSPMTAAQTRNPPHMEKLEKPTGHRAQARLFQLFQDGAALRDALFMRLCGLLFQLFQLFHL